MKKSKLLILGLIALMLAGGLALASCVEFCDGGCGTGPSNCTEKIPGSSFKTGCNGDCKGGCGNRGC